MSLRSLRHLFEPERILWVGSPGEPPRWAQIAEANLWDAGFKRPIRALRSTGRAPAEACLETLAGLAPEPRLAVVCLPQADLTARAAARAHGLRLIGPDRVGVIVPGWHLNTGSAAIMPPPGDLAFVTQSDSIATAMLEWAAARKIGFSRIASVGELAEVELGDILDYLPWTSRPGPS